MFFSARVFAFSFLSLGLLDYARISASPLDISKEVHTSHYDMIERQDPGSASDANSSGIEPEDEDSDQTLADGTGPLRSGKSRFLSKPLYMLVLWTKSVLLKLSMPEHCTQIK